MKDSGHMVYFNKHEKNVPYNLATADQVADLLQVHVRTVYRLVNRGLLPGKKIGGGWRFNRDKILEITED